MTADDVQKFKLARVTAGLAAKTLDRDLKVVRSLFKAARVFGLISYDPSQAIPLVSKKSKRKSQVITREIFTASELDLILAKASEEWKTVILIARYTGARQGDCTRMNWQCVNFEKGLLEYSDQKTAKDYSVPMHPRLEKHLLEIAGSDDPKGLLTPSLAKRASGGRCGLSAEFRGIIDRKSVV